MHIGMLIKSQSEVHLHTGRSVHFHPSQCGRPSFSIFRGSGSETKYAHTMYVCGHLITVNVEACTHLHELRSLHPLHWVTCVTTKGEGTAEEQLKYSGCW